jgi:acyl-CoA-binding protein
MTLNPYNDLPNWLDEGLAVYAEGLPSPAYTSQLQRAIAEDSLISVRSLSSPFSAYTDEASLSYAESYSLVEFLIHEYGQAKMLKLLNTFKQGSSYDEALEKVFGFDADGLYTAWRYYVGAQYQPAAEKPAVREMHPALTALLAALATWLLLALGLASERWAWRRG